MSDFAAGAPPTRRQIAAQETRRKLLDAALEHFSQRPYAEVTVGDIARTAGVAHGLLSHHYNGKQNLYAEAVLEVDRRLRAATAIGPHGSVADRLERHFAAHLEFLARNEGAALNLILRRADPSDPAWEAFESTRRAGMRAICGLLGLDADRPALHLPMRGFAAACDEMTLQWLRSGRPVPVEALVEAWITLLAGAVLAARAIEPAPDLDPALRLLRPDGGRG